MVSLSTYLQENKWVAARPMEVPEGHVFKDGEGLLGVGGLKIVIFVRLSVPNVMKYSSFLAQGMYEGAKYAISLQRSGWTASGKSATTPDSHEVFHHELETELKLLAQGDYFVMAFKQCIQEARQQGYLHSIPGEIYMCNVRNIFTLALTLLNNQNFVLPIKHHL
jgi:hypothetical protein